MLKLKVNTKLPDFVCRIVQSIAGYPVHPHSPHTDIADNVGTLQFVGSTATFVHNLLLLLLRQD